MDPAERDERVMSLAAEALKTPPPQRARWLHEKCGNDPELYREVSEVVTWEERMEGFLSRPLIALIDLETLEQVFEPGQLVSGRFEILRRVGEGGMGVVYEAYDRKRNQRIAIKCAKPGFGRLLSPELEGALKVRHPNICMMNEIHAATTEFGELDFLTMEFLDGETLAHRLARGKLDVDEAAEIAGQLCSGVTAAHHSGILHRDLKPANVILCHRKDGSKRAVITDFGLSTESSINAELSGGTPSYMAPELGRGEKASQASDVFSLGVILYEMVTGQKPFPKGTESNGNLHPPRPPSQLVKGLPHRLDKAILRCLKSQPEDRGSAEDVPTALESKPRKPGVALALAASLVFAAVAVWRVVEPVQPTPNSPPPISLAVLPVNAPADLAPQANEMMKNVAQRIKKIEVGRAMASVIPPDQALKKNVTTPREAAKVLGATHALQVRLLPEKNGVTAKGAIIDLKTMAHVRDYSGHFPDADFADLSRGLAGTVAFALHLHRTVQQERVAPAAAIAYDKGRAYLGREPRDYKDALQEFQKAAQLDPHSPLPLAALAEARVREYQATKKDIAMDNARAWLAKAEALDADSPTVRLASGLLHQIEGDPARALLDYQRVEEIDPGNMEALLGIGFSHELQREPDSLNQAITAYQQASKAAPGSYKPYQYLGALYFYHGEPEKAEEPFRQEIRCAPDRLDGYSNLAGVYIAQAKYRELKEVLARVPERRETAQMLNNIGAKLAYQGQDAEAIYSYKRAIEQNPNKSIYWLNLGDSQRRVGKNSRARAAYRRALQLAKTDVTTNPGSASARGYLAYLQARLGLKEQARPEIAEALHAPTRDDQVVLCAVQTYEVLGERNRALAAAANATPQTLQMIARHPDLAGLRRDPRFISMLGQSN